MNSRLGVLVSAVAALGLMAGCGDPDDDSMAAQVTLSGVVAQGGALAGAAVNVKCAAGSGSTTSLANGSYKLDLADARLPCLLRATSADGATRLHSVAAGSGSGSAIAQITPLSELLLARLAGMAAASYFDTVDVNTLAGAVTAGQIGSGQAAVLATLADAGIDASAIHQVLTDTLVGATAGSSGNAFDNVLLAFGTALANAGATLDSVAAALVAGTGAGPTSNTAALPADMLLKVAAQDCPALRSGQYRRVFVEDTGAGSTAFPTGVVSIDAVAGTLTGDEVSSFSASGPCRYTFANNDGSDFVVSQSGLLVIHGKPTGDTLRMIIGIPVQTHTVDELAGEWNLLGMDRDSDGAIHNVAGTLTVSAAGALTGGTWCGDLFTCEALTPANLSIKANAGGGFDLVDAGGDGDRVFAYRAGSGDLMLISIGQGGRPLFWSKKRTISLPVAGAVTSSWSLSVNAAQAVGSFTDGGNTILTVDSTNGLYTRSSLVNASTGVTRIETLQANAPRDGYTHRPAATVTASDGSASNVSEFVFLSLRGMGITPVALPGSNTLLLSVNKP